MLAHQKPHHIGQRGFLAIGRAGQALGDQPLFQLGGQILPNTFHRHRPDRFHPGLFGGIEDRGTVGAGRAQPGMQFFIVIGPS